MPPSNGHNAEATDDIVLHPARPMSATASAPP
jgi:hypothetical protein